MNPKRGSSVVSALASGAKGPRFKLPFLCVPYLSHMRFCYMHLAYQRALEGQISLYIRAVSKSRNVLVDEGIGKKCTLSPIRDSL